jgi:hypothetical protein
MPDVVVNALVNAGILGPVLAGLAWYVLRRDVVHAKAVEDMQKKLDEAHTKASEAQNKRVEDAQKVAGVLLELNDRWQRVLTDSVRTSNEANATMERIRETLDKVWDRLHLPRG